MKRSQRGFTAIEVIIFLALLTIVMAILISPNFFKDDFNEEERVAIEEQLNYSMIEYYGIFEKFPFSEIIDPLNPNPTYMTEATPIVVQEDELEFINQELFEYTGYDIEKMISVSTIFDKYDVTLTYKHQHIAEFHVTAKP